MAEADPSLDLVECRQGEGSDWGRDCIAERVASPDGEAQLVVRHPDGAFRRFVVLADRSGLATADGADAAENALDGGILTVTVGPDAYRFPAQLTNDDER